MVYSLKHTRKILRDFGMHYAKTTLRGFGLSPNPRRVKTPLTTKPTLSDLSPEQERSTGIQGTIKSRRSIRLPKTNKKTTPEATTPDRPELLHKRDIRLIFLPPYPRLEPYQVHLEKHKKKTISNTKHRLRMEPKRNNQNNLPPTSQKISFTDNWTQTFTPNLSSYL